MPYRRAWELVRSINLAAGEPLVVAATGGVDGGGAVLTPLGRWAVSMFGDLQEHLHQTAASLLPGFVEKSRLSALHVVAAVSLEEVIGLLLIDFALRIPLRVRAVFGASDELADQLLAGSPADLFLSADPRQLDRLETAGLVRPDQRVALAENGLAAIGMANRQIAVRRATDLARDNAPRIALADSNCPLGSYTRAYLEKLHLYDRLLAGAVLVENSRAVITAVRAGQAGIGLVYSSDAARASGCQTLFRVRRTPIPIRYHGAILSRGHDPGPAQCLLDLLASKAAARRFRQCGFHPASGSTNPGP